MKYNQASYKQSHNSYDRDEDSHQTLNAFATDKITGHSWAHVGSTPFVQL